MGYYSKVAYVFRKEDEPKLIQAMESWDAQHPDWPDKVMDLFDAAEKKTSKDGKFLLVLWDYIKWYVDPRNVHDVWFFTHVLPDYIPYDFARVGEEMGDYEYEGDLGSCLICPDQTIYVSEDF